MSTLHRRDITSSDFKLLGSFCSALEVLEDYTSGHLPWLLGKVELWLPVWYLAGSGWRLSDYRPFVVEAIGIERWAMGKICRYLRVREPVLIGTLYRLSMLAVMPGQRLYERPRFRMPFEGVRIDYEGSSLPAVRHGFVIERRRAEGQFKSSSEARFRR